MTAASVYPMTAGAQRPEDLPAVVGVARRELGRRDRADGLQIGDDRPELVVRRRARRHDAAGSAEPDRREHTGIARPNLPECRQVRAADAFGVGAVTLGTAGAIMAPPARRAAGSPSNGFTTAPSCLATAPTGTSNVSSPQTRVTWTRVHLSRPRRRRSRLTLSMNVAGGVRARPRYCIGERGSTWVGRRSLAGQQRRGRTPRLDDV